MAATLQIRQLTLGAGQPKIIVPITGQTTKDIASSARQIAAHPLADLAEWRADLYEAAPDAQSVCRMLAVLREILAEKPLLFTFRTAREGGAKPLDGAQYAALCEAAAQSGYCDLIDVEMFSPAADECVSRVHAHGMPVVGSWHDFAQTPGESDLLSRFRRMQQRGADVLKIAVMPRCLADVEHLIHAAQAMQREAQRPLCAISMGDTGRITRTHCAHFGGCMTFGTLGSASAPGQMSIHALHEALQKA